MRNKQKHFNLATKIFIALMFILVFVLSLDNIYAQTIANPLAGTIKKQNSFNWNFEDVPVGKIPPGWKIEATHQVGPLATWEVIEDKTAPSGLHVLALKKINHKSSRTFNLCWTNKVKFRDGIIEVKLKANSGRCDQGGGIMWRVQDKNNYYVARFNPLEDNFRVYYVRNGRRVLMKSANLSLPAGKWHIMKIIQRGNKFEGYMNGQKLIQGTNTVINNAGGVGLWTKADAATSFDDFNVKISDREKE